MRTHPLTEERIRDCATAAGRLDALAPFVTAPPRDAPGATAPARSGAARRRARARARACSSASRRAAPTPISRCTRRSAKSRLDPRDRAFATELTYGTLRWRGRLDFLLAQVLAKPLARLEAARRASVLRLGAYQLVFCDRVPDAAAVSESVRLAHATGLGRAAGLVNAALRRLARERDAIALPALADDPLAHLVHTLSFPRWLAERWIAAYGAEEAAALATALNATPPRTLRANRRRTRRDALLAELRERFPSAAAVSLRARRPDARPPRRARRRSRLPGRSHDGAGRGVAARRRAARSAAGRARARRLRGAGREGHGDRGARRRRGPRGRARSQRRTARARRARRRATRARATSARCVADASAAEIEGLDGAPFDRILVDAPCSGLGALRRNPDARWRVQPDAIAQLAAVQRAILAAAAKRLRPGGTLVYSTCTLSPEENDDVVKWLLASATGVAARSGIRRARVAASARRRGRDTALLAAAPRHRRLLRRASRAPLVSRTHRDRAVDPVGGLRPPRRRGRRDRGGRRRLGARRRHGRPLRAQHHDRPGRRRSGEALDARCRSTST